MNSGFSPDQSIADVLESLQQSRVLLLDPSPQNIDHCRMMLGQCTDRLSELMQEPGFAARAADSFVADVKLIRSELSSVSGLLAAAATFRRDMLKAMRNAEPRVTSAPVVPVDIAGQKAARVHMLC